MNAKPLFGCVDDGINACFSISHMAYLVLGSTISLCLLQVDIDPLLHWLITTALGLPCWTAMDSILNQLETTLQAELGRFLQSARAKVEQAMDAVAEERDAMLAEVEGKRAELDAEIAAMAKVHLSQESKVELNIGGTSFTTSVSTLRNKPGTMLDAMFSGRYPLIRGADGGVFIDRDGAHFGHVLSYLRDGDVGCEGLDGRALRALKREFGFYSISLHREMEYGYVVGGADEDSATVSSVLRYDRASDA